MASKNPLNDAIDRIRSLPQFRDSECPLCLNPVRVHALQVEVQCPTCGQPHDCRPKLEDGAEPEDVIDAVLEWAGSGDTFQALLLRHDEIISEREPEL